MAMGGGGGEALSKGGTLYLQKEKRSRKKLFLPNILSEGRKEGGEVFSDFQEKACPLAERGEAGVSSDAG